MAKRTIRPTATAKETTKTSPNAAQSMCNGSSLQAAVATGMASAGTSSKASASTGLRRESR